MTDKQTQTTRCPFKKGDRVQWSPAGKKAFAEAKRFVPDMTGTVAGEPRRFPITGCVTVLRDGHKAVDSFHHTFLEKIDE